MSAPRLAPATFFVPMFVVGVFALLLSATAIAQESAPAGQAPSGATKGQPQTQSPSSQQPKATPKAAPKRSQAPLAGPETSSAASTTPGCSWIGKRVIHSLLRDDAVTAQDFDRLYHTFSCASEHLRAAFDCTVAVGALPTAVEAQTRVDSCWTDPKFDTKVMKIGPAVDMPTSSGNSSSGTQGAQPKSGAGKAAERAPATSGGSTPNYPEPKPR